MLSGLLTKHKEREINVYNQADEERGNRVGNEPKNKGSVAEGYNNVDLRSNFARS